MNKFILLYVTVFLALSFHSYALEYNTSDKEDKNEYNKSDDLILLSGYEFNETLILAQKLRSNDSESKMNKSNEEIKKSNTENIGKLTLE